MTLSDMWRTKNVADTAIPLDNKSKQHDMYSLEKDEECEEVTKLKEKIVSLEKKIEELNKAHTEFLQALIFDIISNQRLTVSSNSHSLAERFKAYKDAKDAQAKPKLP